MIRAGLGGVSKGGFAQFAWLCSRRLLGLVSQEAIDRESGSHRYRKKEKDVVEIQCGANGAHFAFLSKSFSTVPIRPTMQASPVRFAGVFPSCRTGRVCASGSS